MRHLRSIALIGTGAVLTAMLLTPVGAHVSNSVKHNWGHYKPLAKDLFFTKAQSKARFDAICKPGDSRPSCTHLIIGGQFLSSGFTRFTSMHGRNPSEGEDNASNTIGDRGFRARALVVQLPVAPLAGEASARLRVNGANTSMACTIGVGQTICRSPGPVTVPANALVSMVLANSTGVVANFKWSFYLERL